MNNISHDDLIEKYLDGTLSESEQMLFDQALADESFRINLIFQAKLLDELKLQKSQEIIDQIKQKAESADLIIKTTSTKRLLPFAFKIAAAFLVLLAVIYFINPFDGVNYDKQFEQYMIDYPVNLIERGSGNENDISQIEDQAILKEALKAYTNNDYLTAASKFELINDPNERLLLNQASAYLRLKKADKAINILRPLCSSTAENIADNANWYLALAYIQKNEIQRAIDLLNVISKTDDSLWMSQAKSLLTELM